LPKDASGKDGPAVRSIPQLSLRTNEDDFQEEDLLEGIDSAEDLSSPESPHKSYVEEFRRKLSVMSGENSGSMSLGGVPGASGKALLDLLEALLERGATADEIEEKFISLVEAAGKARRVLSDHFLGRHKELLTALLAIGARKYGLAVAPGVLFFGAILTWDAIMTNSE
jgi:hypothetical protein